MIEGFPNVKVWRSPRFDIIGTIFSVDFGTLNSLEKVGSYILLIVMCKLLPKKKKICLTNGTPLEML